MTTTQWIRFGLELAWDLISGKLERRAPAPADSDASPYTHAEVERMAKAGREAGRRGVLYGPPRKPPG